MIDILVTVDENYIKHLNVMLVSLFEKTNSKIRVNCIFSDDIKKESLEKTKNIIKKYENDIEIYMIDEFREIFDILKNLKIGAHFKYTMYLRLFSDKIISKKIDKILYLDPDIIINDDIKKLYEIDLNNNYLGAIKEDYNGENKRRLFLNKKNYYNSGVLVINLKKMRDNDISTKIEKFIKNLNFENIIYPDQDIINIFYEENEILTVDPLWNVHNEYLRLNNYKVDDFKIVHYTGSTKPWNFTSLHPYRKYYIEYYNKINEEKFKYEDKNIKKIIKKIIKQIIKMKI